MEKLVGLLLCGGESKRMGSDKGLIRFDNKTWAEIVYAKIQTLVEMSLISINPIQLDTYDKIFPSQNLIIDSNIEVKGPLNGILSAYQSFPNNDFLVLACDMLDVEANLLQEIISIYNSNQNKGFDAFVFQTEQGVQPLVAIYTSNLLEKVNNLVLNQKLQKMSLKYVLELGNTFIIKCDSNKENQFKNRNNIFELD